MEKENTLSLLNEAHDLFQQEGNLIRIDSGRAVFVGDTHGDIDATETVLERYLNPECRIVFLGDYVDRGPASLENINLLLKTKLQYPDRLFLVMGNHEGQKAMPFLPADFWDSLEPDLYEAYARALSALPLVVSTSNGIIALHGALPNVETIEEVRNITVGSDLWLQITWGDWQDVPGSQLQYGLQMGRPTFGRDWFEGIMERLKKNVLIRSHQPNAAPVIFDGRCVTIFTSSAYRSRQAGRTVVITDLSSEVKTVNDLRLETI